MDVTPHLVEIGRGLRKAGLEAVLIGNAAAALQGAPVTTVDFDFMFGKSKDASHQAGVWGGAPRSNDNAGEYSPAALGSTRRLRGGALRYRRTDIDEAKQTEKHPRRDCVTTRRRHASLYARCYPVRQQ